MSITKEVDQHITMWNKYARSQDFIEIDITYNCNLKCYNCNRSCTQAPTNEHITLEQIYLFINQSIQFNMKWKRIRILGGEPTLHPQLLLILDLFAEYRKTYSEETIIQLVTNGFGKRVNDRLLKISNGVAIENSSKVSRVQNTFSPFNVAPADLNRFKGFDFSGGCWIAAQCGIGLTPYGYYPCAIAGGIDRVFGLDLGRKRLPAPEDEMLDLFSTFCRYCGHFAENERFSDQERQKHLEELSAADVIHLEDDNEIMSQIWVTTYNTYKKRPPKLTRY